MGTITFLISAICVGQSIDFMTTTPLTRAQMRRERAACIVEWVSCVTARESGVVPLAVANVDDLRRCQAEFERQ